MSNRSTRDSIVAAADDLFYRHGFEPTSFADIADVVGISRGNFYHHFKTKDDLLEAVIDLRLIRTKAMLDQWESHGMEPAERIRSFIHILIQNQSKIMMYGCPVGTLSNELAKLDHTAKWRATDVFSMFLRWLSRQFAELGRTSDANALAMHVLARSQGVAALATAFRDEAFVRKEVEQMEAWLASLSSTKAKSR